MCAVTIVQFEAVNDPYVADALVPNGPRLAPFRVTTDPTTHRDLVKEETREECENTYHQR